ncbi:hypothetical protein SAMN04488037_104288 [Shimia marina]|uniref:Uncharacterized protein n=1 Tax=Shimia marina TaxID=321267 RepID=A0A0P1EUR6_9RHOB|nr:hypothetical protein SHM7688_03880 [Shimia marina]SFE02999.1 hypothetical protein SAMN04488037_104288 [Shimia marina]
MAVKEVGLIMAGTQRAQGHCQGERYGGKGQGEAQIGCEQGPDGGILKHHLEGSDEKPGHATSKDQNESHDAPFHMPSGGGLRRVTLAYPKCVKITMGFEMGQQYGAYAAGAWVCAEFTWG